MRENLRKIYVKNFKSIASAELEMKDVNILLGANGAGKSNFISIFKFLGQLSNGKLKTHVLKEGGADRIFHFGTKKSSEILLKVSVGYNEYHGQFGYNPADDALFVSDEYCKFDEVDTRYALNSSGSESGLAKLDTSRYKKVREYTKVYLDECRVYHFHDTSVTANFKKTRELNDSSFLESDAGNIAPFLFRLKESLNPKYIEAYNNIVDAVKTIAPFFHDFYLKPSNELDQRNLILRWTHTNQENPFSANALSDGTARFICMATLFLQPEELRPATIILDEPELGLHPAALNVLGDIFKATSKHTQIICSTQSVSFANLFEAESFIIVDAKDGISRFRRLESNELEHWLDKYLMGEIWEKNLIGGRPTW